MKTIFNHLTAIALFSFFFACNESGKHQHSTSSGTPEQELTAYIQLNNGSKWVVSEAMSPFIFEAENTLEEFISKGSTDHKYLAAQLKDSNSGLIKGCNMKGKAHDELHNWLHPHMKLLESLQKTENEKEVIAILADLRLSFEVFHKHFELTAPVD